MNELLALVRKQREAMVEALANAARLHATVQAQAAELKTLRDDNHKLHLEIAILRDATGARIRT